MARFARQTERSGGQKGRGLGGRNPVSRHRTSFCPPSLSDSIFFPPPPNFVPVKLARRLKLAVSKIYKNMHILITSLADIIVFVNLFA